MHLVHASLAYDEKEKLKSVLLSKPELLMEAHQPYTTASAIDVLLNSQKLDLVLYADSQDPVRLEHRIQHMFGILEQIIDYQHDRNIKARQSPKLVSRTSLKGWSFDEIAKDREYIYPRSATLRGAAKSWINLTSDINAVTLFGRGFGEVI